MNSIVKDDKFSNYVPGRGQILITQPIKELKFQGTFHFEDGYYYFRTIHNRVLFGGGRNLDLEGETTDKLETSEKIIQKLNEYLQQVILPNQQYEIDMKWSGIMGFWKQSHMKKYIYEKINQNVFAGVSCCGMGVALTYSSGLNMAQLMDRN